MLLSITGGTTGIAVGMLVSLAISSLAHWAVQVPLPAVLGGFIFSAAVGICFGYPPPARKGSEPQSS